MTEDLQRHYAGKIAALEYLVYMVHHQLFLNDMNDEEIKRMFSIYLEENEDQGEFGKGWDSVFRSLAEKALEALKEKEQKAEV